MVTSDHTVLREDVKFNKEGCLVGVRSSKTSGVKGSDSFIPVTYSLCAARALRLLLGNTPGTPRFPLFVTA